MLQRKTAKYPPDESSSRRLSLRAGYNYHAYDRSIHVLVGSAETSILHHHPIDSFRCFLLSESGPSSCKIKA